MIKIPKNSPEPLKACNIFYKTLKHMIAQRRRMQEVNKGNNIDNILLEHFQREIWSKVPHLEEKPGEAKVVNATPLIDITEDLRECAKKSVQPESC
jgi:hypothetical protein